MNQSLMKRVGRLVSGAAHQIVDAAEGMSPEAVMEQAVREISATIDEMETERGRAIARGHLARSRRAEENTRHEELKAQCRVALAKGRRDLAETAMSQIMDIEAQIPVLGNEIEAADAEGAEIEGNINGLVGRRNEMRDEIARIEAAGRRAAIGVEGSEGGIDRGGRQAREARDASDAFDRAASRSTGLRTEGAIPDGADAHKRAELEALERSTRIEDRLLEMEAAK